MLSWTQNGIEYEADQRHADLVVSELGLGDAKGVTTPGTNEDSKKMLEDVGEPLPLLKPHNIVHWPLG